MIDQSRPTAPTATWHCLIAAICTLGWLAVVVCVGVIIAILPAGVRESKAMFLVPTVFLLGLTFGATLSASVLSSRRAMKLACEEPSREGQGGGLN
jgi:hypothetical protein